MRPSAMGWMVALCGCAAGPVDAAPTSPRQPGDDVGDPDGPDPDDDSDDPAPPDPDDDPLPEEVVQRSPTPCLSAADLGEYAEDVDAPSVGLVIFDRSGSMDGGWSAEGSSEGKGGRSEEDVSKWDVAGGALLGALEGNQDRVTLGALFFPQPSECSVAPLDDERQVPFRAGPEFIATWGEVAPRNLPGGSTPLLSALVLGERAIEDACNQGFFDRRFFVIVVTDGMPNCTWSPPAAADIVGTWLAHGIATYVIGLPGSEDATAVLDDLAAAGGTETIVVPGSPSELEDDMDAMM